MWITLKIITFLVLSLVAFVLLGRARLGIYEDDKRVADKRYKKGFRVTGSEVRKGSKREIFAQAATGILIVGLLSFWSFVEIRDFVKPIMEASDASKSQILFADYFEQYDPSSGIEEDLRKVNYDRDRLKAQINTIALQNLKTVRGDQNFKDFETELDSILDHSGHYSLVFRILGTRQKLRAEVQKPARQLPLLPDLQQSDRLIISGRVEEILYLSVLGEPEILPELKVIITEIRRSPE